MHRRPNATVFMKVSTKSSLGVLVSSQRVLVASLRAQRTWLRMLALTLQGAGDCWE